MQVQWSEENEGVLRLQYDAWQDGRSDRRNLHRRSWYHANQIPRIQDEECSAPTHGGCDMVSSMLAEAHSFEIGVAGNEDIQSESSMPSSCKLPETPQVGGDESVSGTRD